MTTTEKTIDQKLQDIVEKYNLEEIETTRGMNGYPEWTNTAFYSDSMEEMNNAIEKLQELGCEINELWMTKRDGQHFWNRSATSFSSCDLKAVSDSDWCVHVDMNEDEESIKEVIRDTVFGTPEEMGEDYEVDEDVVDDFYTDVESCTGEACIFYDSENRCVNYVVDDETTGYYYDAHSYQMGFEIELPEEEEEE